MLSCASPRPRANTTAGPGATCAPKTMKLTGNTSEMLRHYVGNRKKGHIFMNVRTGKRLTLRHFEKMIDKWAGLLNIQKLQSIKPSGREYHLITLMGPKGSRREAPRSTVAADVSAKAAGHSKETKAIGGRYNYFFIASAILSGSESSLSFTLLRTSSLLFIP
ncbi:MAG TPA: hypothetical protein VMW53_04590 [archaeon]|nr:hypothetical protein [archaeon]